MRIVGANGGERPALINPSDRGARLAPCLDTLLQRGIVEQPLPLKDRVERAVLCARRSKAVLE
jgi:hypothetical protein